MAGAESARLRERALRVMPGGVDSNVRLDASEVFFAYAEGAWLSDVDGRSYVDYMLGQGPNFLGHAHPAVVDAVTAACRTGTVFGAQHRLGVQASERVLEELGWADQVRFGLTGTEMVQAALRAARAATGRTAFVRFEGHYHGWLDNVLTAMHPDQHGPMSAGQPEHSLHDCVVLGWNDLAAVENVLTERDDIAAVLMEPLMVNTSVIEPASGYLDGVRRLCDQHGVVLIFDEVITGFRVAPDGAAGRFGVTPDLATYGKAMAGGFPVAAVAGSAELLGEVGTGVVNHSGTFNGHVLGAAATVATLDVLRAEDVHARVERYGAQLHTELGTLAREHGLPLHIQGVPAALHASFGADTPIEDARGLLRQDGERYRRFVTDLYQQGIWVAGRGVWYTSAAHGEREWETTQERVASAMRAHQSARP